MNLNQLLTKARASIEADLGPTRLNDPQTNKADALVQAVMPPLAGLEELYILLDEFKGDFDVRTTDCEKLLAVASLIGEAPKTNRPAKYEIIVTGSNGTTVSANRQFTDSYSGSWTTESPITIRGGVGFGSARSPAGEYTLSDGELSLTSPIEGVAIATNGAQLQAGYTAETCEQFRARLLAGELSQEQEIIKALNEVSDKAWLADNLPDCLSPDMHAGFVVVGGNDSEIAEVIRQHAPVNYVRLAGNTSVNIGCETVRFIRPCLIDVEVNYWGSEVSDADIQAAIESGGLEAVAAIKCISRAEFKLTPQDSSDCPCDTIDASDFEACSVLPAWQHPVFAGAELKGGSC